MKVSLEFIRSRMKEKTTTIVEAMDFKFPKVDHILWCTEAPEKPEPDALYVYSTECSKLEGKEEFPLQIVCLKLTGDLSGAVKALVLEESADIYTVFNEIQTILTEFQTWEQKIYRAIIKKESLDTVFSYLTEVTDNPWYLADASFRVQVISQDPDIREMSAIWKYMNERHHLPIQTILSMVETGDLALINSTDCAVAVSSSAFNVPFVSKTIFSEDGILGHFFIINIYSKTSVYDLEIADTFGDILKIYLKYASISLPTQGRFYDNYFIDLLEHIEEGDDEPGEAIRKTVFQNLGWLEEDLFVLIVYERKSENALAQTVSDSGILSLENIFPCYALPYKGKMVILLNLSFWQGRKEITQGKLESLMRKEMANLIRYYSGNAGYSRIASGTEMFLQLYLYYRQAVTACLAAENPGENKKICGFVETAVPYICGVINETLPQADTVHPAVRILQSYDQEHQTSLLKTLQTYLELEQNSVRTAETLYMHRNSLLYRLHKIGQLTQIDLNDPMTRFHLLLSIYLL